MKKKWLMGLIFSIMMLSVTMGCSINEEGKWIREFKKTADFPIYNSLNDEEKDYYAQICEALEHNKGSIHFEFRSEEKRQRLLETFFSTRVPDDNMMGSYHLPPSHMLVQDILFEQGQYFWISPVNISVSTYEEMGKYCVRVQFEYIMGSDQAEKERPAFDKKVADIVAAARAAGGTFEQVQYVHDYLCENVQYDETVVHADHTVTSDYSSYGALMSGRTVCAGYTQAFELLMRELGYECGVEFTDYDGVYLGDQHVWNYVKLDGEYYYFDVTWDDYNDPANPYGYEHFGVTTDELRESHTFYQDLQAPVPYCGGTKYNYYRQKGLNMSSYSFESVSAAIMQQVNEGRKVIGLRFDDYGELCKAKSELFDRGRIYELIDAPSIRYGESGRTHHYVYIYL